MNGQQKVYVRVVNEDVAVWRPVMAERVGGETYRLLDNPPDDEMWEFATGSVVRCDVRQLSGDYGKPDYVLVALERV